MNPFAIRTLVRIVAGVVFAYIVYWLISVMESVTTILMVSFLMAYILNPLVLALEKIHVNRSLAALMSLLIVITFVTGLFFLIIPAIVGEIASFSRVIPRYVETLQRIFFELVTKFDVSLPHDVSELSGLAIEKGRQLLPGLTRASGRILSSVFSSTISVITTVFQILLIPIIAYYLLVSFESIKKGTIELLPEYAREPIINKFVEIDGVLSSFVRGQLTISFIMAILYSVGFIFIGIDLALVIGIVSGLLFIVPYLGTMIALIFAPIMAFAKFGDLIHVFYVFLWIGSVQVLETYVLTPNVVGQAVGLHPVVYIMALVVGGNLFGVVGMLVAVPVAAVLKVLLISILQEYKSSYLYHDKSGKEQTS